MKYILVLITSILFFSVRVLSQTILYVGEGGGEYSTIALAYAACSGAGTNYIIEIKSTYTNTESKPIAFPSNVAGSVIIRPHSSISSNLNISTATQTSVFNFTGGDNIIIDGRVNSSGTTSLLTIENTQAAYSRYAIQFSGGSTVNALKYLTIKGSNTDTAYNTIGGGVVMFASGSNNNNTIDHCTLKQSGSNFPAMLINSYDPANNNSLSITNNEFVNFGYFAIIANGTKNFNWTITSNSFYADYVITGINHDISIIKTQGGGGHTITGNYFGGRAANCGGLPYTVSTNDILICIDYADSEPGYSNTISGNVIQNISYTSTKTTDQFSAFYAAGGGNFNYGSSGNPNIVGSTSGTGNITITDNSSSLLASEYLIGNFSTSGTISIQYNVLGSITCNGSNTANKSIYLASFASGTVTYSNNTIGNTTANNISFSSSNQNIYGAYIGPGCVGTFTCQNNVFRNLQNSATAGSFQLICDYIAATITGNTFSTISSASASTSQNIIFYNCALGAATISSNTIQGITTSNSSSSMQLIYAINSSATTTISNNTIGTTGISNDISLAGNTSQYGIYAWSDWTVTVSSNVLQNITLTSSGTSSQFYGMFFYGSGTVTSASNSISNINSASTAGGTSLVGIYSYTTSGATIHLNTIYNINLTTSSSYTGGVYGFYEAGGAITFTKNKIYSLSSNSTDGTSNSRIAGAYFSSSGVNVNCYNNVVLISNSSNTNAVYIYGVYITQSITGNFYHNTVKISGSTSAGSAQSGCFFVNVGTGTYTVRNNIFQNLRTGGSGRHGAIMNGTTGNTWTESYNYLEGATSSTVGCWGNTDRTFAAWNTSSGASNNTNSTIAISSSGTVPAGTTSDVKTNGANLTATVNDDIEGNTRATAPWRGAYETYSPLPIELVKFSAFPGDEEVHVSWTTLSETNNDFFTIERSNDMYNFEPLAFIRGAGNSTQKIDYSFTDVNPYQDISYYRLKQTDFDGSYSYSQIACVKFSNEIPVTIFPNPTSQSINLSYVALENILSFYCLYDAKGKMVREQKEISLEKGINKIFIDLSEFETGIYFILLKAGEHEYQTKIIRQ
jgi:hypothetical protein